VVFRRTQRPGHGGGLRHHRPASSTACAPRAPLDGIYLDLHGAMITERISTAKGALLRLIRAEVGPDLPIAISLDLHANLTQAMVDLATSIAIFRTYPHLDMAETGARCLPRLLDHIAGGAPPRRSASAPISSRSMRNSPARTRAGALRRATDGAELPWGSPAATCPMPGPRAGPCRGSGNGGRPRRRDPRPRC
jgi:hypothetical protein